MLKKASSYHPSSHHFYAYLEKDESGGIVSNEGGLKFRPVEHEKMIDVSDIDIKDCGEVIDDIRRVFDHVRRHEMETFNETAPEGRKIDIDSVPGKQLVVKKLSPAVLPTVLSEEDGTIYINENFVKVMYRLKEIGLKDYGDWKHGFNEETQEAYIYNVYDSILYSIALHEVRGHFRIENGVFILDLDEERAHRERGRRTRIFNLAAIIYFWMMAVEGRDFIGDRTGSKFLMDNPALERELSTSDTEVLTKILEKMYDKNMGLQIERLPRVEIPGVAEAAGLTPVDMSDWSVGFALEFLEKMGAEKHKKRLEETVEAGNVLMTTKEGFTATNKIIMERSQDRYRRAWAVFEQFFSSIEERSRIIVPIFNDAFNGFCAGSEDFELSSYGEDLPPTISALEDALDKESVE